MIKNERLFVIVDTKELEAFNDVAEIKELLIKLTRIYNQLTRTTSL